MEQAITVTLEQITVELKVYFNQWGQNTIEIGKRLAQAKGMLPHGEWLNWLEKNFSLSQPMASNFMRVAERFGNYNSTYNLNQSQMIAMLALPAEETEKFIAEKAAEGTPVEDMTVKQLREKVSKYKADYEAEKAKVENLFADLESEKKRRIEAGQQANESEQNLRRVNAKLGQVQDINRNLQDKITVLENQKPQTVEPKDYQQLKKAKVELQNKINALQKKLGEKTIEVVTPDDYESTKKELAELKAAESEMVQRMDVFQKLSTVASLIQDIIKSPSKTGIQDFMREYPEEFGKMCAAFLDFTDSFYEE